MNFQAAIIKPQKKGSKRLRDTLENMFSHLNSSNDLSKKELNSALEIPGLVGGSDFYPYVYFNLNLDFI